MTDKRLELINDIVNNFIKLGIIVIRDDDPKTITMPNISECFIADGENRAKLESDVQ